MSVALFLRGSCTVSVPAIHRTAAMNLCMQLCLPYRNFRWCDDGSIRFCCTASAARRFLAAGRAMGMDAEIGAYRGLPRLLSRIGKRAGLVVGAFLAMALIVASSLFVWDVQVSGNVELSEEEVLAELRRFTELPLTTP